MLKLYYRLAKPGIIYGNLMTTIAAFLFATKWHFPIQLLIATIVGVALAIASACVFNNILDRDIDAKMPRTKERALVSGAISIRAATLYGTVLGIAALAILYFYVNPLTCLLAVVCFISYVVVYGYAKRTTSWSTVVGSISGAMPITMGYTAATGRADLAALILFLVLVFWQMPHFYAIGIYRLEEYKAAGLPILPAQKGIRRTKFHMLFYIVVFILAVYHLTYFGYAGYSYLAVMLILGLAWLALGLQGFRTADDAKWARKLFFFSLIVLTGFSLILSVAPFLP